MKLLIIGVLVILTGILLIAFQMNITEAEPLTDLSEEPKSKLRYFLFPYLIPLGLIISTAGLGEVWPTSKRKKKKRL